MHAAVLLFTRFAALDAVTGHDALTNAGIPTTLVAEAVGPMRADSRSIELTADAVLDELPAPTIVVIPGGAGASHHVANGALHRWLRTADLTATAIIAIGTGTLIPASAGLLSGRLVAADDHTGPLLAQHGATPAHRLAVLDGKYATAVHPGMVPDLVRDVLSLLPTQSRTTAKGSNA